MRDFAHSLVGILVVNWDERFDIDGDTARKSAIFNTRTNRVITHCVVPVMVRNIILQGDGRIPMVPLGFPALPPRQGSQP